MVRSSSGGSATGCHTPVSAARRIVARETPAIQSSGPPGRTSAGASQPSPDGRSTGPGICSKAVWARSHPLVELPASTREVGAEQRELALHPARRDRRDDPAAREEVERRELLQSDERVALRHDER